MAKPENRPDAPSPSGPADSNPPPGVEEFASSQSGETPACGPLLLTCLGLLAGPLAWLLIMQFGGFFKLPEGFIPLDFAERFAFMMDPENNRAVQELLAKINYQNTLLTLAIVGAALAGVFGLGGGIRRKSIRAMVTGTTTGMVLGAVLGVLTGIVVQFTERQLQPFLGTDLFGTTFTFSLMYLTLALHAMTWSMIGIAVGLAIAIPTSQDRVIGRSVVAAITAGPFAAYLFMLLGVFLVWLFNNPNPDHIIPAGAVNRLCWTTVAAVMMGLFVGTFGRLQGAKT